MASPAFGHDSLIIVTYDEWGAPGSKLVAFVAVGPLVAPGSVSATAYTHYSLLRTIEDGYGLHPYLGGAAHTTSITSASGRATAKRRRPRASAHPAEHSLVA